MDGHLGHFQFGTVNRRSLWMFLSMSSCGHKLSFLLGVYLGKELLGHWVFTFRFCKYCQFANMVVSIS